MTSPSRRRVCRLPAFPFVKGMLTRVAFWGSRLRSAKAAPVPVMVHYETSDGTAVVGQDYLAATGDVTFAAGQTEHFRQRLGVG